MDRITESFLNEFIAEHELEALAPSEQFEHLAAFVTVRRHYVSETFSPTEIHTGGGGDTGIDAIAILVNGALVTDVETLNDHADISGHFDVTFVFIQADRSNSFDGKKVSDFGFGVKDFFEQKPRLARNQHITNAAEVMEALYHQGTKFRPGNPACRLYFVTTGTWANDHDLDARRCSVEKDLRSLQIFRDVKFMCVDAQTLQTFYRETKNAIVKEFTFTNRLIIPEVSGVNEANVGFVPLSGFLSIVTNESGDLLSVFDKNVRDWQEYVAPVNDEIRATLISDHKDRFVLMNNGVTIVARTLRTVRRDRIQIEDFQIVNGCQTTHVLYDQREKADPSVYIPLRVIATQDEDVVRSISRGTNRQTKVDDDQFFALTEFAVQIEEYIRTFPDAHSLL